MKRQRHLHKPLPKHLMLLSFMLFSTASFAQFERDVDVKNHFFTGGSAGLQFGTYTNISISPVFGYHFNNVLSAGIGGTYQFYKSRYYSDTYNIYGGRMFLRAHPFDFIFIHAEYELLTYKTNDYNPQRLYENVISENLLGGIGYREHISDRVSSYLMLLYNFNENIYTPYSNPVFRFGIEFNFPASRKNR